MIHIESDIIYNGRSFLDGKIGGIYRPVEEEITHDDLLFKDLEQSPHRYYELEKELKFYLAHEDIDDNYEGYWFI